ncbi:leucine-rich repeat-containing protein 69 isoform X2 [Gadus chalcogrammus]|uniref:leucine-rich repeat-containing protein 69 isoform X2 n=1 Tax=Gadus chalcogrammus TaxID=1042646 RepID=UPI0024C4B717|nr:leucine-rich repeat-containing protein 69 isoform X2 [Gadus chalcogrammus]
MRDSPLEAANVHIMNTSGVSMGTSPAKTMSQKSVIRAIRGNAKSFDLSGKAITSVPTSVSEIQNLCVLRLQNNLIRALPEDLTSLYNVSYNVNTSNRHWKTVIFLNLNTMYPSLHIVFKLTELHLSNNAFGEIPSVLGHIKWLKKLYLSGNRITALSPLVCAGLGNLVVLNLNHNKIQHLPPEIKSLAKLERLTMTDNKLEALPPEFGQLSNLIQLNLSRNHLSWLPGELYSCRELTRLYVARNRIKVLPVGIRALAKLNTLDVAGNKLSMFPVEFHMLPLQELYCEGNQFVQQLPITSVQELAARLVLLEDRNKHSKVHRALPLYPCLEAILAGWGHCPLCLGPILNFWLECVHFLRVKKGMKMSLRTVPVRAVLCSYECFNREGHSYYGVSLHSDENLCQPMQRWSLEGSR